MDPAQWVGRDIDGRYRVESVLGVGGMGTVLRAKHTFTGVPVALKILHPQFQLDPDVQGRFLAEAQAPNQIGHPAIVKVTDAGRTAEGTLYMAMELLTGRSLRAAVGKLSPDQIKRVLSELLAALGQAHARGFVHRDLKPDNVFLCAPADEVKLLDFGIAKVLDDVRRRTAAGAVLGTPAYMAPEQLHDASAVDSRADLWAVGVMLYELITGRLPLAGSTVNELMVAVASCAVIPIRQLMPSAPPELEQFFARALNADPRRRFGAAIEMAHAIGALTWGAQPVVRAEHPGSTVASYPGSTVASVASAPRAPIASPGAMPGVPQRSSKGLLVVGVLAVAAIVVGVVAIAMSGGARAVQVAATADAPTSVEPPTRDANAIPDTGEPGGSPAPRDAGIATPADAARTRARPEVATPLPPDAGRPEMTCSQRCVRLAQHCGTHLPTCEQDCATRTADFVECFEKSERSCVDGAVCGIGKVCGAARIPAGHQSCAQVADCQAGCGFGDINCACNCDQALDPRFAWQLGRFNACALRALAAGCRDAGCGAQMCRNELRACGVPVP